MNAREVGDPTPEAQGRALPLATGQVTSGPGEYCGYSVRETASVNAEIDLYDSTSAPGANTPLLETITLQGLESSRDHYARPARQVANGIYAVITGTIKGSIFV